MKLVLLILMMSFQVWADEDYDSAVKAVHSDMQSPEFQKGAAKNSPEAKAQADAIKALTGGNAQAEQEIYKFAADIMVSSKCQDIDCLQKYIAEAQRNPAAFAQKLTPEQKNRLKELSKKLPMSNTKSP